MDDATGVGAAAMETLVDDMDSLCLVKECRDLEEGFGTRFTDRILGGEADLINMKEVRKVIGQRDREKRIELCEGKGPLIAAVARNGGWLRVWDLALELGLWHTRGLQALSNLMSSHGRGTKAFPRCEEDSLALPVLHHVVEPHLRQPDLDSSTIYGNLITGDVQFLYLFWKCAVCVVCTCTILQQEWGIITKLQQEKKIRLH